jgi:hypothetical protein
MLVSISHLPFHHISLRFSHVSSGRLAQNWVAFFYGGLYDSNLFSFCRCHQVVVVRRNNCSYTIYGTVLPFFGQVAALCRGCDISNGKLYCILRYTCWQFNSVCRASFLSTCNWYPAWAQLSPWRRHWLHLLMFHMVVHFWESEIQIITYLSQVPKSALFLENFFIYAKCKYYRIYRKWYTQLFEKNGMVCWWSIHPWISSP